MNVDDFDHCTVVLNDDGSDKTVLMDTHAVEKMFIVMTDIIFI